jgi:hypothetical protein
VLSVKLQVRRSLSAVCLYLRLTLSAIPAINVTTRFSSRDIAEAIFNNDVDLRKFCGYHASYKNATVYQRQPTKIRINDDDSMDIDDNDSSPDLLHPSHALDLLHIQVVEHFKRLLVDLIGRVGGPEIHENQSGTSLSRYAPSWTQKNYLQYSATDCLNYLETKQSLKPSRPRLDVFLSKPYTCPGARRGQDWSRKDWYIALTALGGVGDAWGENSIRESLQGLEVHLESVLAQPMRPTGI